MTTHLWDTKRPGGASTAGDEQVSDLAALRWHWGDAYEIGCDDGTWWYERRDGIGDRERAGDPVELYRMITGDYEFRPVRGDDVR